MSLPDFIIVDGMLTVEAILQPSWLIRRRIDDSSLTAEYGWVATLVQTAPGECEVKGYLARQGFQIVRGDRLALKRIGEQLGFTFGQYERVDKSGNLKTVHKIYKD